MDQPTISLSQRQTEAWEYLEDETTTEVGYGGAAGGGKSYLGCVWHIYRRLKYPYSRGLIGRAKISNLEESTLVTLFSVASELGYRQGIDFIYNSQKHTIKWANGSMTVLKDLFLYPSDPDFISLGSTEFTDVFIDEAPEITRKAKEIVASRIRYKINDFNLIPKLFFTCNPSPGWVKEDYISNEGGAVVLKPHQKFVRALLTDNPDRQFRELYTSQLEKMSSDYDRQRLLFGDWDVEREIVSPFAPAYKPEEHESTEAVFDINKRLYISIDFNLIPFAVTFRHRWTDVYGSHCHQFDEAAIVQGSVPAMIDLILQRYRHSIPSCLITGDYNGNKGELSQRDNASLFEQIRRGLQISPSQIVTSPNPTHQKSGRDVNYVLTYHTDFKINPDKCKGTCRDMRTVQVDNTGSIIKANRADLSQRADFLDCVRYDINSFELKWIDQHQKKFGRMLAPR